MTGRNMPTDTLTADAFADEMKELILVDMRAGRIPDDGSVATFGDLHDHVDANEYLIAVHERHGIPCLVEDGLGDYIELDNAACAIITRWLDHRMIEHRARIRRTT